MPHLRKCIIGTIGSAVVAVGTVVTAAPAQAAPIICDPNTAYYVITSQSSFGQVDPGDYHVYYAPATASLTVSESFTAEATTSATETDTLGAEISVEAGVGIFNAEMGLSASSTNEMQVKNTVTRTVTMQVVIPAGHSMVSFVGHQVTRAYMARRLCNSSGTASSDIWRGSVTGPRFAISGFKDCIETSLC